MLCNKNKLILLFSILLVFLVVIPASFAEDNQTALSIDVDQTNSSLAVSDYYFDANAKDDAGDGSASNPYKTFNSSRVKDNSTLHFADGKYDFDEYSVCGNVSLIGSGPSKTIINNLNIDLKSKSTLLLKNIQFTSTSISGDGNMSVENVIFNSSSLSSYTNLGIENVTGNSLSIYSTGVLNIENSKFDTSSISSYSDSTITDSTWTFSSISSDDTLTVSDCIFDSLSINVWNNFTAKNSVFKNSDGSNGGVINARPNAVDLINCTFQDNTATYGGVIYITGGRLNINDCTFTKNTATQWGGVISAENTNITIKKSRFMKNKAESDAGGVIYLKKATLNVDSSNFTDSSATFGSAVTALISDLTLTGVNADSNTAKYDGGAVYVYGGNSSISKSTFSSNNARNGGAIFIDNVDKVNLNQNKFTGNTASELGSAVYSIISNTTLNNIKSKNTFSSGDEIYFTDTLNVEIGSSNYTFIKVNYTDSALPSSYRSPYVTSVKNQGSGGNCWAFTASATLESAIKKATGKDFDLSEENMKNIMSLYSDYGWQMNTNSGGYDDMGFGYLAAWLGPVLESDDEYNSQSVLSPLFDALFHVQNILFIQRNNQTDTEAIKDAVYKYGAVGTCIYWSGSYNKNGNYYYDGSDSVNHAVTIIGWDDNYSKDNFKTKPAGDGAWIIKNSWGTGSGNKGYFYVSYYDTRIAYSVKTDATFAFILDDAMVYDKNYQYDIPGRTDYMLDDGDVVWYKNKFTATDDEYLSAVSTHFEYPTDWTVSVYVNNALKHTQSGSSPSSYSTISLGKLISLKKGDSFEIVFNVTNHRGVTSFPISEVVSLNHEFYTPGISYFSKNGKTWTDLYDYVHNYTSHTYKSQVACIKAFTIFDKLSTSIKVNVSFNSLNTLDVMAVVSDSYGNIIKDGEVTFAIDKTTVKAKIVDGIAKLTYTFKNGGQDTVKATFAGDGYISSSNQTKFNMTAIVSANVTRYYDNVAYEITLQDANKKAVANKKVIFNVNGQNYTATTNNNGKASIKFNLPVGNYSISTVFEGDRNYLKCEVSNTITAISTITLPNHENYTYNAIYSVALKDLNGNDLANTKVNVKFGNTIYSAKTDSNGKLSINITLKSGTYEVVVKNPETSEEQSQTINVLDRIVENKKLTMYFGSGASYKVKVLDDWGNPLKGAKVTFVINKRTYTKTTDSNGYASLTINLKPNTYTITASYNGYKVSNKVVVKTTIITKDISVKKGKTIKFTAKLLNTKGKILKNKKIKFKFKGKTYKVKTNSKGIATLKITKKYKAGKYTISSTYGKLKIKNKIKIKK